MTAKMYFIAVLAPPEVNEKVLQWKRYMHDRFGCVVALRSPAHVTLVPPFWMHEELEPKLADDLTKFSADQHPLEITLKDFDAFKPRVIFVHVEPNELLNELHNGVNNFLQGKNQFPIKKESRPFHPHVTIANRDLLKKDFEPAMDHYKRLSYQEAFPVTSIALLKHNGSDWQAVHVAPFKC